MSGGTGAQGPVFSDDSAPGKSPALYIVTGWGNTDPVLLALPGVALLQYGGMQEGEMRNAEASFSHSEIMISQWELEEEGAPALAAQAWSRVSQELGKWV